MRVYEIELSDLLPARRNRQLIMRLNSTLFPTKEDAVVITVLKDHITDDFFIAPEPIYHWQDTGRFLYRLFLNDEWAKVIEELMMSELPFKASSIINCNSIQPGYDGKVLITTLHDVELSSFELSGVNCEELTDYISKSDFYDGFDLSQ